MCTTMTSYPGWCAPTVTTCTKDSDCPAWWKCLDDPETAVGSGPAARPGFVAPPAPDAGPAKKTCQSSLSPGSRGAIDQGGSTTGPVPGNGGMSTGEVAPPKGPAAGGADAGASAGGTKSGGCVVASGVTGPGAGLAAVALLGLALAVRRRRPAR
jgi:MYXO-CTERM domain-containing protein